MDNCLKAWWYHAETNFGDSLNPHLLKLISGKEVKLVNPTETEEDVFFCIGSIMHYVNDNAVVWGTGMIDEKYKLKAIPKKITAVRGPETQHELSKLGISCPEIYGDPSLLISWFYQPKVKKKYDLGIIPHYVDKNNRWLRKLNDPVVKILDIQKEDPFRFIDDVLECEMIASSSLHGLIIADAYGIPSTWLEFSDKWFGFSSKVVGEGFKFRDYFLSVNREVETPLCIKRRTSIHQVYDRIDDYKIDIDLKMLYDACPFKK